MDRRSFMKAAAAVALAPALPAFAAPPAVPAAKKFRNCIVVYDSGLAAWYGPDGEITRGHRGNLGQARVVIGEAW